MLLRNNYYHDQLNLKFLFKNQVSIVNKNNKKAHLYLNLYKIESFTDTTILEGLFLLEFLTGSKTSINKCVYKYKLCNIQLIKHLNNDKNLINIFNVLKVFYLPALKRQNISSSYDKILSSKFTYSITDVNLLPFLPSIYYKWKTAINMTIFFNKKTNIEIAIFLMYIGFYFNNEKDLIRYFNYIEKKSLIN